MEGSSLLQTSPFSRAFWTISEFFENSTNLSIQKFIDAKDKLLLFHRQVASDSFVTPWTVAGQAPLSMRFSGQKDWSRLPFSSPEDLPNSGIQPNFPELADSLPLSHQGRTKGRVPPTLSSFPKGDD